MKITQLAELTFSLPFTTKVICYVVCCFASHIKQIYLRNEFNFWNVHGIMNTSGLLQSFALTLQETQSIHDSMNIPKTEFIAYIYILS